MLKQLTNKIKNSFKIYDLKVRYHQIVDGPAVVYDEWFITKIYNIFGYEFETEIDGPYEYRFQAYDKLNDIWKELKDNDMISKDSSIYNKLPKRCKRCQQITDKKDWEIYPDYCVNCATDIAFGY